MKFEIICGNKNDFEREMSRDIKSILAGYPHKITIANDEARRMLAVQSESQIFEKMKLEVVSKSVSYLLYSVKLHYYQSRIKKFLSDSMHFILLKVLVFSDFDKEKDEILSKLYGADTVVLDGVYNFLIRQYERDWQRGCNVINMSVSELKNEENFKEFVKSMSCTITSRYPILYLFCGSRNMVLSDKLEKIDSTFLEVENMTSEEKVIATLVENYPMNVAIYEESKEGVVSEALRILFDVRKKSKSVKSI